MGDLPVIVLPALLGLFLVLAGIEDVRRREIANWKNAAIALAAPLWWWAQGLSLWPDVAIQLALAGVVFALFAGAYAIGQMGGGDVKLLGALALWLPLDPFVTTFVWMAFIGGALTSVMIVDEWIRRRAAPPKPSKLGWAIGVALAAGAAVLITADGAAEWLSARPAVWLLTMLSAVAATSLLLFLAVRSAKRRGIAPETPYGVAIALAGLLTLREPIINHFG